MPAGLVVNGTMACLRFTSVRSEVRVLQRPFRETKPRNASRACEAARIQAIANVAEQRTPVLQNRNRVLFRRRASCNLSSFLGRLRDSDRVRSRKA